MRQNTRVTIGLVLGAVMTACSPSQPADEPEVTQAEDSVSVSSPAAELPVSTPTAPVPPTPAAGSMVVYGCDDGSGVTVTYDDYTALVKLPSGSTTLSRADAEFRSGEVAYLSEELSVYRNGDTIRMEVAGRSRICSRRS